MSRWEHHRKLGEAIHARRTELGYQIRTVARMVNISPITLSRFESGYNAPTAHELRDIAAALDTTMDELMGQGSPTLKDMHTARVRQFFALENVLRAVGDANREFVVAADNASEEELIQFSKIVPGREQDAVLRHLEETIRKLEKLSERLPRIWRV